MSSDRTLAARDVDCLIHPFTNLAEHAATGPLVIERGEGAFVFDRDGNRYLEGMAGLWCVSLGFGEERLVRAAEAQMRRLPAYHLFGNKSYAPAIELADRLLAMAPVPMSKVLFTNSGSEANDTAMKLVRYYQHARGKPDKRKIIARERAYHGVTLAAASLTGLSHAHDGFGLPLDGVLHTGCPDHYREAHAGESEEQFASRLAADLEQLILHEGPETVGAFIAEPMMGAGGVVFPPRTYFEKIQAVLDRYDVLLIADEVITGFGRTGEMFGCETFGIRPDIMTVAKALSSGYAPIGAVLVSQPIFEAMRDASRRIGTFGHGFTYSGHPTSAAIALETLKIYEADDILGHVRRLTPYFKERTFALADHPLVGDARAAGLVGAIELMADKARRIPFEPHLKVGARVTAKALGQGVILRPLDDIISLCPPLIVTEAEIDLLFDTLGAALDQVAGEIMDLAPPKVA